MSKSSSSSSRTRSFRSGVLSNGVGTAINIAFLFLETSIAARVLQPETFGVYMLLVTVVNFFVMLSDFGIKTGITQTIASSTAEQQSDAIQSVFLFRVIIIAALSVLAVLGKDLFIVFDDTGGLSQYIVYVPLMLVFASFDELLLGMIQGCQLYQHMAIVQIIRSVLRLAFSAVLLITFHMGIAALIYSWSISFAVSCLYQYLVLPISKRPTFNAPKLWHLLRFSFPIQLTRGFWFVYRQSNTLILGIFAGPASVAFFAVAMRIPDALQRLSDSFIAVYFPAIAVLVGEGKRDQASAKFNQVVRLMSFATAAVALGSVVFSTEIVTLLFSRTYASSAPAFALLMLGFHVTFIVNLMGYTLTAAGNPAYSLVENITRTTVNIVGSILLVPIMSFVGPALATLVSGHAANPVVIWLLRRCGISVELRAYVRQILLLLVFAGAWFLLPSAGFVVKALLVLGFVGANLLLSTISLRDLHVVLPRRWAMRLWSEGDKLPA